MATRKPIAAIALAVGAVLAVSALAQTTPPAGSSSTVPPSVIPGPADTSINGATGSTTGSASGTASGSIPGTINPGGSVTGSESIPGIVTPGTSSGTGAGAGAPGRRPATSTLARPAVADRRSGRLLRAQRAWVRRRAPVPDRFPAQSIPAVRSPEANRYRALLLRARVQAPAPAQWAPGRRPATSTLARPEENGTITPGAAGLGSTSGPINSGSSATGSGTTTGSSIFGNGAGSVGVTPGAGSSTMGSGTGSVGGGSVGGAAGTRR